MSKITDELEQLASLRERGVLTEAEFAAQKAALLGSPAAPASPPPPPSATEAAATPEPAPVAPTAQQTGGPARAGLSKKAWAGIAAAGVVAIAVASAMSGSGSSPGSHGTSSVAGSGGATYVDPDGRPVDDRGTTATATGGSPSEDDVKQLIVQKYGEGNPERIRFQSVEIGPNLPSDYNARARFAVPDGGSFNEVRVTFTNLASGTDWNNPSAYIHDRIETYAVFKNNFGSWTMESDKQAGDKDELRGAYAN